MLVHLLCARFASVRILLSDMGTEMHLIEAPNVLDCFFEFLRTGQVRAELVNPNSRLFPNALYLPGWMHLWDGIARDVCAGLLWFPDMLAQLRGCIAFFRQLQIRDRIRGLKLWTAEQVESLNYFPHCFAKWRWGTLHGAVKGIFDIRFLCTHWQAVKAEVFGCSRDSPTEQVVDAAFSSDLFWLRLEVVRFLLAKTETLRTWGAGCYCHEKELRAGKSVACIQKGRPASRSLRVAACFGFSCHWLLGMRFFGLAGVSCGVFETCEVELGCLLALVLSLTSFGDV